MGPEKRDLEPHKQAKITCLRLLAATPKSRIELKRRLAEKGYAAGTIDAVIRELESEGILNDRGYAENLKARFTQTAPSGSVRIDFEMKRRGIPAAIREELLGQILPEEERERAREIGRGKWQKFSALPSEKRKKRVYDFLVRRGFGFQTARELLEEFERLSPDEGG